MNTPNQKKPYTGISENTEESEVSKPQTEKSGPTTVENIHSFVTQKAYAKSSPIQDLIRLIVREVRREHLDYDQVRYIFRSVRHRCELAPPNRGRRLIELPTDEEIERFMGVCEPVHRLLFEFVLGTGLRVSELCCLEVRRVNFADNTIFVNQGKGGKDRIVLAGSRLLGRVALYLEGHRKNRYVFESNRNTKFSSRRIEQLCARYRSAAGITKPLHPHIFRHLWATRLAMAGVSTERRAVLAGHSDLKTQQIYVHLSAGGLREEVVSILDRLDRGER